MKINTLKLENFKNYDQLSVAFSEGINLITGLNGSGKTNLLDAIHYLALTKSAFQPKDAKNVTVDSPFYLIVGEFEDRDKADEIKCYYDFKNKIIRYNDLEYDKISEHIGKIPLILSTPNDISLIRDGNEVRRKWIDGSLAQIDQHYLENLLKLQRVLRQRNALLKNLATSGGSNEMLLDTYDNQLIECSRYLSQSRKDFLDKFTPHLTANVKKITPESEHFGISFETNVLDDQFEKKLKRDREKDKLIQRTSNGSHKDKLSFLLDQEPIKYFGSQGQQKSFLLALKLAQYDYLIEQLKTRPILMLDDLFDKLDDRRIQSIAGLLENRDRFGQIFVTDARKERAIQFFNDDPDLKKFEIAEGKIVTDGK